MSLEWIRVDSSGNVSLTNLNTDEGTLFVDKDNDRVGIGNTTPQTSLHVGDSRTLTGTYERDGNRITVTTTSVHNFTLRGTPVKLFFSSGDAIDGVYSIEENPTDVNIFECLTTNPVSGTSSGGVTVKSTVYFIEGATYTGKNNFLTVVLPNHGFRVNDQVTLFIDSGDGISGTYTITGVSGDGLLFIVNHPTFASETNGTLRLEAPLSNTPKESVNGAIIYNSVCADPKPEGNSTFSGTLWVNSTNEYQQNCGASVTLGGLNYLNSHTSFARISGVNSKVSNLVRGDFTVETLSEDPLDGSSKMYERLRITSDGRVGIGTDAPRAGLDIYNGSILTNGVYNVGYDLSEADSWGVQGGASPNTHLTSLNSSTILEVDPSQESELGFNLRLVSNSRDFAVFGNKIVSNYNPSLDKDFLYVSGKCEGGVVINYILNKQTVAQKTNFSPSPPSNFRGSAGFLAKVREDGTPFWAVYQDSEVDDSNTGACILNRGTSSPFIVCGGFVTTGVTPTLDVYNQLNISFSRTLGGKGYYIVVYDDAGVPKDLAVIYGAGAVFNAQSITTVSTDTVGNFSFYTACVTDTNSSGIITIEPSIHTTGTTTFNWGTIKSSLVLAKFTVNGLGHISLDWYSYIKSNVGDVSLFSESFNFATVDSQNNFYVTGRYGGAPVLFHNQGSSTSVAEISLQGGTGAFIAKYNSAGQFQWVSKVDGPSDEFPTSLVVDSQNNVYMAGMYTNQPGNEGIEFYNYSGPTSQTKQLTLNPPSNNFAGYVCKYNSSGQFQWATVIEGEGSGSDINPNVDEAVSLEVDNDDNITVNMLVRSSAMIIYNQQNTLPSAPIVEFRRTNFASSSGTLFVKYNSDGKCLLFHRSEGDGEFKSVSACVSSKNQIYATGITTSEVYRIENPDGSSFSTITDRSNNIDKQTDAFVVKLPFYPTFVLRNVDSDENYRKRLINTSTIASYVTFYNHITDLTYGFTYVPSESALDLQYAGKWLRVSNVFRGVLTVDDDTGYVGVGTQAPGAKFEVAGDMRVVGNLDISSDVYAKNIFITSDRRLKRDIKNIDGEMALDVISRINPVEYTFKDAPTRRVFGFVAQEVEREANIVSKTRGFVPDVYAFCSIQRKTKLIQIPSPRDGVLRLMMDHGPVDLEVSYFDGNHVMYNDRDIRFLGKIFGNPVEERVFVYGFETNDVRKVDMQSLFSINMAATKELLHRIKKLERGNKELKYALMETLSNLETDEH